MEALSVYTVKIRRDEAGYYVARCMELPSAMTQGKTEEEVIRNIKKAIHLVLRATQKGKPKTPVNEPTVSGIELIA